MSDDDFRKLHKSLKQTHIYGLAVAYVDKKLSAFESLQFSLFSHFLGNSLQKFYTGFVKENWPKNETQKKSRKFYFEVRYSKSALMELLKLLCFFDFQWFLTPRTRILKALGFWIWHAKNGDFSNIPFIGWNYLIN